MLQIFHSVLKQGSHKGFDKPENMTTVESRVWQCLEENSQPLDRRGAIVHWLQQQAVQDPSIEIRVPTEIYNRTWPKKQDWQQSSIDCQRLGEVYLLSIGSIWQPNWLEDGKKPVFTDTWAEKQRRIASAVPIDPGVQSVMGDAYTHYQAPGQRDAVRAALMSEPGSTLLVNLPTGTGKTLVGQVMTMFAPRENALSIVIVPTVALALEQASRYRQEILRQGGRAEDVLAWHSGLESDERSEARKRIRQGTQRLIVTSPEAACSSLTPVLFDAAENGGLRNLIIDEAHLVIQWGTGFRPEFQQLGGLVRGLRNASITKGVTPCSTILMTATLTEDTRQGLRDIFDRHMTEVHACHLRPEPSYWSAKAPDLETQNQWVIEALANAPRPLILYFTKPGEARQWHRYLQSQGYGRVGEFTGKTGKEKRTQLLEQWTNNELDIMVATSAFGVGMDKNDVRCVIHATYPENMDRYYQEVGRSGRDGKAATSIMIYTEKDALLAKEIGTEAVISVELGHERWESMWERAEALPGGKLYRVNLKHLVKRLKNQSKSNRSWNLRTILLMVRAGVIQLDAVRQQMPEQLEGQSDDEYEKVLEVAMDQYRNSLVVKPLVANHTDIGFWKENVEPFRKVIADASNSNFEALRAWLKNPSGQSLCQTLTQLYQLSDAMTMKACGGCPVCRQGVGQLLDYSLPKSRINRDFLQDSHMVWTNLSGIQIRRGFLMYQRPDGSRKEIRNWEKHAVDVIKRLYQSGVIASIRLDRDEYKVLERAAERQGGLPSHLIVRFTDESSEPLAPHWPELWIPSWRDGEKHFAMPRPLRGPSKSPLQLVMVPDDMVAPNHPTGELFVLLDNKNWIRTENLLQSIKDNK
ncbi:protein DpdF [Vibrio sp. T13N]|uniref:protein DpdF n=1 Tax=Vibrio sp. T13N TaxID=3080011 RepID=UPI0029408222|nr:protein DpdF [Vibrio sp. T13N]MDV5051804.1 protein DpdF [Vibrio sp. T13N]